MPIGDVRPAPCPSYLVCPSVGPGPAPPLPLPARVRPVPEQTGRWLQGRSPPGIPCGCRVPLSQGPCHRAAGWGGITGWARCIPAGRNEVIGSQAGTCQHWAAPGMAPAQPRHWRGEGGSPDPLGTRRGRARGSADPPGSHTQATLLPFFSAVSAVLGCSVRPGQGSAAPPRPPGTRRSCCRRPSWSAATQTHPNSGLNPAPADWGSEKQILAAAGAQTAQLIARVLFVMPERWQRGEPR